MERISTARYGAITRADSGAHRKSSFSGFEVIFDVSSITITGTKIIEIGRNAERDGTPRLWINHNRISRNHAAVTLDDDALLFIEGLGSTFGTYLDGERIRPNEKYPIADGDAIQLSDLEAMRVIVTKIR